MNITIKTTKTHQLKPMIMTGFATILFLIVLLIGFWSKNLSDNKQLLVKMANKTVETRLITELSNNVHQQTIILNKLATSSSAKQKDDLYTQFVKSNDKTQNTYNQLSLLMKEYNGSSWGDIIDIFNVQKTITQNALNTYKNVSHDNSYDYLIDRLLPTHDALISGLSDILNKEIFNNSQNSVDNIINEASNKNTTTYVLVYMLGGISIFLGIFTIFILKRTGNTETALVDQGERIQQLYEATSISGISLDDRITETLKLGCRVLGMEIGKLGRQNPEKNESMFLNTIAPPELPAKRGLILPLDKTFCNVTFSTEGPIAIHHVSKSSYRNHPAAAFLGMEAYIGTTIYVHDKKFGTVNFSNRAPMDKPFTQTDIDFVNLLGKWISVTMEQIIVEDELQKSKDAAESANQAKTAFLANMSHEIRTPLTAILGYSEMLLDEDQSAEDFEHEINSIVTSGVHLQQIINDILDLSKIEAGQLVIEHRNISVTSFLNELETILGPQAHEKGLTFDINHQFPIPATINTDPTRLKQILINLCGNAIKFTREGSISISTKYIPDTDQIAITVTDTGIGMSEDEIEKIFNPFTQADESTTRIYGGTGLGLCISKQLSQKLGGDVTVISEKGKGSSFTATIDTGIKKKNLELIHELSSSPSKTVNIAATPNISLAGHILLVEDNAENQKMISKSIRKIGLTVDIADNGQTAYNKALAGGYDLILMDIQMPIMDGLEATRKLRESGYTSPIISLTANAMQEDRNKCFESGADDYLAKPLDFSRFYDVLSHYLSPTDPELTPAKIKEA